MADPVGVATLGWTVTKFLNQVVKEFQRLKNVPSNVRKLRDLLERLEPSVEVLGDVPNTDQPAGKWLAAVNEQLQKAHAVAGALDQKDKLTYLYNFVRMSRKVEKVFNSIRDLLIEASAHQWASRMTVHRILAENDARKRDDFERLREKEEDSMQVLDNLLTNCATKADIQREFSRVEQALSSHNLGGSSTSAIPHGTLGGDGREQVLEVKVTFGGDAVLNDICTHLLEGDYRKWVGLWGMGGIGKTFTARKIYHDPDIRRHFRDGILWVTVSKEHPDANDICKSLIRQVYASFSPSKQTLTVPNYLASAKMYLKKVLQSKKVLLILDDVWKDSEDDYDDLLQHLDVVSEESESVILVTTRDETVLAGVGDSKRFEIPILSKTDSWLLFSWYAFRCRGRQIPPDLEGIAKAVARECGGLPLALEVIGSTMASRRVSTLQEDLGLSALDAWQRALDHLQKASFGKNEYLNLYARLQLSVDSLEDHWLDCSLYFAAFPEDYNIPLEKPVTIWTAEGLVGSEEDAKFALAGLVAKSMIDMTNRGDGECTFRVHDVMRDLAQRNLKRDLDAGKLIPAPGRDCLYASGLMLSDLPEEWFTSAGAGQAGSARTRQGGGTDTFQARRLSLTHNYNLLEFPGTHRFRAPQLQVLLLSYTVENLSADFFGELSNLKVLDISYTRISSIPDGVLRGLTSLVLLDLTGCDSLTKVSDEVNGLQYLQNLNMTDCFSLTELPRLNKLTRLRFCSLSMPRSESQFPWFPSLHNFFQDGGLKLRVFSNDGQTQNDCMENQIEEEEEKNDLRQTDERVDEDEVVMFPAKEGNDDPRKHEHDGVIGPKADEVETAQEHRVAAGVEDFLPLLLPTNLRELQLRACGAQQHPENSVDIGSLFLMERLTCENFGLSPVDVANLHHLTYVKLAFPFQSSTTLFALGKLPKLEHLVIKYLNPLHPLQFGDAGAFPCLKSLSINLCRHITNFAFQLGIMPKIEDLRIIYSVKNGRIPPSIAELWTLKRLHLDLSAHYKCTGSTERKELQRVFSQDNFLPNLEKLRICFGRRKEKSSKINLTREIEYLCPQHWVKRWMEKKLTIVIDGKDFGFEV